MKQYWTLQKRIYGLAGLLALGIAGLSTFAVLGTNSQKAISETISGDSLPGVASAADLRLVDGGLKSAFTAYDQAGVELMLCKQQTGEQRATLLATGAQSTGWILMLIGGLSLLLGLVACCFLVRRTRVTLGGVVRSVATGAERIASASGQISAANQSLGAGASELSASLAEASCSLEELSSAARRNAEGTAQAGELTKSASQAADRGWANMESMAQAMRGIQEASEQVAKTIKTMDALACQANTLALNASIEAAHAGKAGLGFAVVAGEFRSLAQRSAAAARETADLIRTALQRTSQGVQLSAQVHQGLSEIVGQIKQADQLVARVGRASREQCQSLEQVNTAVSQMSQATQSSVADAEESASASDELMTQAEAMGAAVDELQQLVGGSQASLEQIAKALCQRAKIVKEQSETYLTPAMGTNQLRPPGSNDGDPQDFRGCPEFRVNGQNN